jgi:hypothetical protein
VQGDNWWPGEGDQLLARWVAWRAEKRPEGLLQGLLARAYDVSLQLSAVSFNIFLSPITQLNFFSSSSLV